MMEDRVLIFICEFLLKMTWTTQHKHKATQQNTQLKQKPSSTHYQAVAEQMSPNYLFTYYSFDRELNCNALRVL